MTNLCLRVLMIAALLGQGSLVGAVEVTDDTHIVVSVSVPHLVLGNPDQVDIGIAMGSGVSDLVVRCNIGKIENLHLVGDGVYVATFVPPPSTFPQIAVIAALGRTKVGTVHGYVSLPLWGRGDAEVDSRPYGRVMVHIGHETFGPVQADSRGAAAVPVVVPPGVRFAYDGKRQIDLNLPSTGHLLIIPEVDQVYADRRQEVAIWIFATTTTGEARPDLAAAKWVTSRGTLSNPERVADGVFRALWTLPPGVAGVQTVTATVDDDPGVSAAVEVIPAAPAHVLVHFDKDDIKAGIDRAVTITVDIKDVEQNPTHGRPSLSTNFGELGAIKELSVGHYQAGCSLPSSFAGRHRLEIRAQLVSGLSETSSIPLVPAPAEQVRVSPSFARVVADGLGQVRFYGQLFDRFGNEAPGQLAGTDVTLGRVVAVAAEPTGAFTIDYLPPHLFEEKDAQLHTRLAHSQTTTALELLPPHHWLLGAQVGLVTNFTGLTAPSVSILGGYHFVLLRQNLVATAELGYFEDSHHMTLTEAPLRGQTITGRQEFIPIDATLAWQKNLTTWLIWAGVAVGVVPIESQLKLSTQSSLNQAGASLLIQAFVGVGYRLGIGYPAFEWRGQWLADPRLATYTGQLPSVTINLGYRFEVD